MEVFDVTIVGGGPAGLYSAFYSGLREMKTKIIDYQAELGGKVHIYPEKVIWDIGGLTPMSGENVIKQMVEQAMTFDPTVVLNEKVESIDKNEMGLFQLHTGSGEIHYSKTIIVAVGGGILHPKRLNIEGAEKYEVTNLNYKITSLQRYKDKRVIISGGGNSAVDWANELVDIAKSVYLTYRKDVLSGHEAQVTKLMKSSAECYFNCSITKLISENNQSIEHVELTNHESGDILALPIDEVIINHGYDRDIDLLDNSPSLGVEIKDGNFIAGSPNSESSVPGIYAAGDILHHEGKLHLIAGAFQDAANAVNQAKKYIDPQANTFAMVSSHNELFKERNEKFKESAATI
ncbi:NAD(P)/FAD-dependent oxidoreductase [Oceanobacillus sp. 1P07AA]|uniref:NAD(P)/FAD-dependent oxidoreductase n=1 Tax=Oceanobacillus sp. 1P07AA TaxID=3132293 RepID=UPI0039A543B2